MDIAISLFAIVLAASCLFLATRGDVKDYIRVKERIAAKDSPKDELEKR